MYEDMTKNAIREAILSHMGADISKIEGSFAADMAAAVSVEMAKIYATIDYAMQTFLLQTNEGEYLDLRAAEYGITRKPGTKATVEITASGTDGAVIPAGTRVVAADGLVFVTDAAATILSGTATIAATADQVGSAYNAAAGTLTQLFQNIVGVEDITNTAAATGGSDSETDEALRERVLFRLRAPATSGNAYHYQQWALDVAGVGAAKVLPLWAGAGTVKVVLASPDMGAVNEDVRAAAAEHIETQRPIGADVTVVSATAKEITVAATLAISADTTLSAVKTAFSAALKEYFQGLAFDASSVSYNKIAYLLMSVPGVNDYSDQKINGGTSAIPLQASEVPAVGTVTLSAAG